LNNQNVRNNQNADSILIIYKISEVPATLPAFEGLGSIAGGLTEPPEDKLEGELPG
jgi:hypothetical protein